MGICGKWGFVYSSAPGSALVFACTIFLLKYISNGIFIFSNAGIFISFLSKVELESERKETIYWNSASKSDPPSKTLAVSALYLWRLLLMYFDEKHVMLTCWLFRFLAEHARLTHSGLCFLTKLGISVSCAMVKIVLLYCWSQVIPCGSYFWK